MPILVLSLGAALGAALRYYLSLWAIERFGATFPYGTLIVNALGSFILGFFLALATGRVAFSPSVRLFVTTGFCGSLTTFSTFSYETFILMGEGKVIAAIGNAAGSVGVGLLCVALGALLARALVPA